MNTHLYTNKKRNNCINRVTQFQSGGKQNAMGSNRERVENVRTAFAYNTGRSAVSTTIFVKLYANGNMIHSDQTLGACTHTSWWDHFISGPCKQWIWIFRSTKVKIGSDFFLHIKTQVLCFCVCLWVGCVSFEAKTPSWILRSLGLVENNRLPGWK